MKIFENKLYDLVLFIKNKQLTMNRRLGALPAISRKHVDKRCKQVDKNIIGSLFQWAIAVRALLEYFRSHKSWMKTFKLYNSRV